MTRILISLCAVATFAFVSGYGSASAQPAPFAITSPIAGAVFSPGDLVPVRWTGGDPAWLLTVYLLDMSANTVADGSTNVPNTGGLDYTVPGPHTLGWDGPCGRSYRFYVENLQRTSWTYGEVFTVTCRLGVGVDIEPGTFPNSINLGSNGVTPVAILGSPAFDVHDIDVATLTLGTAGVKTIGKTDRYSCRIADVSGDFTAGAAGAPDGIPDLVCQFVTASIVPEQGGTTAKVMGTLFSGVPIEGVDSVNIVP